MTHIERYISCYISKDIATRGNHLAWNLMREISWLENKNQRSR